MKTNELKEKYPAVLIELEKFFNEYDVSIKGFDRVDDLKRLKMLNIFMGYGAESFKEKCFEDIKLTILRRLSTFDQALANWDPKETDFIVQLASLPDYDRAILYPEMHMSRFPKILDALYPIEMFSIKNTFIKFQKQASIKRCLVPRTDTSYMERKAVEDAEMIKFWEESIQFAWAKHPCPF
jgi:hypothetical protein